MHDDFPPVAPQLARVPPPLPPAAFRLPPIYEVYAATGGAVGLLVTVLCIGLQLVFLAWVFGTVAVLALLGWIGLFVFRTYNDYLNHSPAPPVGTRPATVEPIRAAEPVSGVCPHCGQILRGQSHAAGNYNLGQPTMPAAYVTTQLTSKRLKAHEGLAVLLVIVGFSGAIITQQLHKQEPIANGLPIMAGFMLTCFIGLCWWIVIRANIWWQHG